MQSKSALAFCSAFYEMLARGSTVAAAFEEGKFQANIARPVDPELFQIHYTEGMANGEVTLFSAPDPASSR